MPLPDIIILGNFTWLRLCLVTAAVVSFLSCILAFWKKGRHLRKLADKIPGPPALPLIGHLHLLIHGDLAQSFKVVRSLQDYGTVTKFWAANLLFICVSDPMGAEKIIGNKKFLSRTNYAAKIVRPFLKNGILISEGETWKSHRRMLAPHFGEHIVKNFLSIFHIHALNLADRFQSFADGSSLFRIHELAFFCTMNVAWETTTGTALGTNFRENVDIPKNVLRGIEVTAERFRRPWLVFDWIFNFTKLKRENDYLVHYFHKIVQDILNDRVKEFKSSGSGTNLEDIMPLVDRLLADGEMTTEEIHVEMLNVLGAASETSATMYCYTLCMLGVHQDVQERVFQEQKSIFQDEPHRMITWEDLQKMTYTEQVMKEVLRIYPPLPLLFRTVEEDTDVGGGCILPKGSNALVFTFSLHRNPRSFPDPEKFDPERFSVKNSEGRHPYSYLPFGGGRRNCMGYKYGMMLIKTMLSITLRRYRVVNTVGGREAIDRSLELGLIVKPASGFNVQIMPREVA